MLRIDEKDDEQRLLTHTNTHRELHPMERVLNEAGGTTYQIIISSSSIDIADSVEVRASKQRRLLLIQFLSVCGLP